MPPAKRENFVELECRQIWCSPGVCEVKMNLPSEPYCRDNTTCKWNRYMRKQMRTVRPKRYVYRISIWEKTEHFLANLFTIHWILNVLNAINYFSMVQYSGFHNIQAVPELRTSDLSTIPRHKDTTFVFLIYSLFSTVPGSIVWLQFFVGSRNDNTVCQF